MSKKERQGRAEPFSWDVIDFATPIAEGVRIGHSIPGSTSREAVRDIKSKIIAQAKGTTISLASSTRILLLFFLFNHATASPQQRVLFDRLDKRGHQRADLEFRTVAEKRAYDKILYSLWTKGESSNLHK